MSTSNQPLRFSWCKPIHSGGFLLVRFLLSSSPSILSLSPPLFSSPLSLPSPLSPPSLNLHPIPPSLHHYLNQQRNYLQVLLDHTLTDDQVVSYMLLTLLVGYHTVLTTLCCTTHQLAAHPPHQQTLYNEISNSVRREVHVAIYTCS